MSGASAGLAAFLFHSLALARTVDELEAEAVLVSAEAPTGHMQLEALSSFGAESRVQAVRMGRVYELLYCLENSMRDLIESTLKEHYGGDSWWTEGISEPVRKAADKRSKDDAKARWHGPRGGSPLAYVDFPQYGDIMVDRWDLFEDLIGDQPWLLSYISEMNRTRRALAHTGTLADADVERMDLRVREWLRVVG